MLGEVCICIIIQFGYFSAAVDAFRKFLDNTKSEDIVEVLDNEACWEKFEDVEEYPDAINVLTRYS